MNIVELEKLLVKYGFRVSLELPVKDVLYCNDGPENPEYRSLIIRKISEIRVV